MSGATLTDLNLWISEMMKYRKYSKYELDVSGNSLKGDGYLGEVTFVKVIASDGKNEKKYFDLVIKSAKKSEEFRKRTPIKIAYDREIFMYTKLLKMFYEFQMENNIETPFEKYATCYSVCTEEKKEAVILENLKSLGYEIHDRMQPQNLNQALMIFQNYAKFHAISLALRHRKPALFKNLTKNMSDVLGQMVQMTNLVKAFYKDFQNIVHSLEICGNKNISMKYKSYNQKTIENILLKIKDPDSRHSVVLHGDCWNNNMMFKYEGNNKTKPTDMVFLDFQLSSVGSPACDLSYYLYCCTDNSVLQHFDFLLQAYYSCLSDALKGFGCEAEDIFTFKELKDHWKTYGQLGLVMSPFIVKLELSNENEVVDFANTNGEDYNELMNFQIKNQDTYERRLRECFIHFANNFL